MLVSFIIPAYNVEKYIAACLDSCLAQVGNVAQTNDEEKWLRADEMEIIVVDDGSTDGTPELLSQYTDAHPCILLYRQENQGQSVARNLAISKAQGEYIYMVDSDDQMMTDKHGCVLPLSEMRSLKYDIIGLQVWYQPEHEKRRPWSHQMECWPFDQTFATGADFVKCHNIEGLVYGYVFRRRLFTEHPELRFTPGIYHQDEELIFKIFTLAGSTIYKRGFCYLYFEHTGSSINTRTAQRKRKLMDDIVTILRNLTVWRDRFGISDTRTRQLEEVMHYKLSFLAMDMLRKLIRDSYADEEISGYLDDLRQLNLYPLPCIHETKYRIIRLLTCHPRLVCWWARHRVLNQKIGF